MCAHNRPIKTENRRYPSKGFHRVGTKSWESMLIADEAKAETD
jgi:hypothetical protein